MIETTLGAITLDIRGDVESAAGVWDSLLETAPFSPSQTYSYARAWVQHVMVPEGRQPVVAIGYDKDTPLFLWAFELGRKFGQPVLIWLGQGYANYNMGLHRPEVAERLQAEDLKRLLRHIADRVGASAALFDAQPFDWGGCENPFARLPHQPHPSCGYAVNLGDFEELYHARFGKQSRRKYARRERKLAEEGPLAFGWAESDDEKHEVLETFFSQRELQFAKMGVEDPFTPPIRAFCRELVTLPDSDPARLRLGYIRVGDFIPATFSGSICRDTLAVSMSSLAESDMQRYSPGLVLLRRQIEWACNEGLSYYDIGVGGARHKERWSDVIRPLFDSFIAFKPQGLFVTLPLSGLSRAKRSIKNNRTLWPLAQKIRRQLFGQKGHASSEHDD